ncbi:MAG: hypothetical protein LBK99_24420 [Opitutaceae bacterium]|jgi:hypothetical protein|nr:hypothetical protein [Opitutaceae bacterium]
MNTHTIKSILPAGVLALAVLAPLYGSSITTTIYSDDFNRSGNLGGSSPVIGPEAPSWATNASWISSSNLTIDGSKVAVPEKPGDGGTTASSNAYLPANITVNSGIYELTITYAAIWGGANSWVAFGFATSSAGTDAAFFNNAIGMTAYSRGNDNWTTPASITTYANQASNSIGSISGVNRAGSTPLTVKITLDTYATTNNLTVTTLNASTAEGNPAVRSLVGTLTSDQINSIQTIKIGAYQGQAGSFDNLSFTVTVTTPVPEPAVSVIVTGALVSIFWILRRSSLRATGKTS